MGRRRRDKGRRDGGGGGGRTIKLGITERAVGGDRTSGSSGGGKGMREGYKKRQDVGLDVVVQAGEGKLRDAVNESGKEGG